MLEYTLKEDGTYEVSGFKGNSKNIKIPKTYKGIKITSIGNRAFEDCISLTSIVIPDSVTSIGFCAFDSCYRLTKVNYLGTIDDWVQISFDTYYANPLFYAKNLYINDVLVTEAEITTATKINDCAFHNCSSLTSVTIGNSVTSIGNYAFHGCSSLISITIGNSVTSIRFGAFEYCRLLTSIVIPDSVTSIGVAAFYNCTDLTSVTIPNSVTSIGGNAFERCYKLFKPKGLYFKGFNSDLSCIAGRKKQYHMGMNSGVGSAKICEKGYHYCDNPYSVLNYYSGEIGKNVRFCLVEPYGETDTDSEEPNKHCCTKIKLIKEFNTYAEMFKYYKERG